MDSMESLGRCKGECGNLGRGKGKMVGRVYDDDEAILDCGH
jgi:hypothetical protein